MTMTVLPASTSRSQYLDQLVHVGHMQAGGGLVQDIDGLVRCRGVASSVASLTRWASPPDRVVAAWPSWI